MAVSSCYEKDEEISDHNALEGNLRLFASSYVDSYLFSTMAKTCTASWVTTGRHQGPREVRIGFCLGNMRVNLETLVNVLAFIRSAGRKIYYERHN